MVEYKIGIIGLGYVGLPLALAFAKKYRVIAFDIDEVRTNELSKGIDHTYQEDANRLKEVMREFHDASKASGVFFTADPGALSDCNTFIVAVPTPVDERNEPDLSLLKEASATVASYLRKDGLVIYESTVYPGCTEEVAVPILEQGSGLRFNEDFFCGYSPERINPGDKTRTLSQIKKITSGSTESAAMRVDSLYSSIITAGTFPVSSMKVAEAAKVIENAQRDINIAFVNELSKIFHVLGINTQEVLQAAATKWNFLAFQPGLVGGHCIGIDPYYLVAKARMAGYQPNLILAAREVNDSMGEYVAERVFELMDVKGIPKLNADALIMGITFKENFADVRNSKVAAMVEVLKQHGLNITIFDPLASPVAVERICGLTSHTYLNPDWKFDVVILAVSHAECLAMDHARLLKQPGVLFDIKGNLTGSADGQL